MRDMSCGVYTWVPLSKRESRCRQPSDTYSSAIFKRALRCHHLTFPVPNSKVLLNGEVLWHLEVQDRLSHFPSFSARIAALNESFGPAFALVRGKLLEGIK